jgi:hypothetical protein
LLTVPFDVIFFVPWQCCSGRTSEKNMKHCECCQTLVLNHSFRGVPAEQAEPPRCSSGRIATVSAVQGMLSATCHSDC